MWVVRNRSSAKTLANYSFSVKYRKDWKIIPNVYSECQKIGEKKTSVFEKREEGEKIEEGEEVVTLLLFVRLKTFFAKQPNGHLPENHLIQS